MVFEAQNGPSTPSPVTNHHSAPNAISDDICNKPAQGKKPFRLPWPLQLHKLLIRIKSLFLLQTWRLINFLKMAMSERSRFRIIAHTIWGLMSWTVAFANTLKSSLCITVMIGPMWAWPAPSWPSVPLSPSLGLLFLPFFPPFLPAALPFSFPAAT